MRKVLDAENESKPLCEPKLQWQVDETYRFVPIHTFQHDGDWKHTAKLITNWLEDNHIRFLD